MTYYKERTGESFKSTAVYPNRVWDKQELESICDLVESGSPSFIFKTKLGSLIAQGYLRIVYGDHGPYIEFLRDQVILKNLECERDSVGYYNKWYSRIGRVLVYEQLHLVRCLPNPPAGKRSYRGNRKEGYADYRVGRFYVSPYDLIISVL